MSAARTPRRRLLDAGGLLVGAGLCAWAVRRMDFDAMAATFREGRLAWVSLALATLFVGHATRLLRWTSLSASAGARRRSAAALAGAVGLLSVTVLPFRLGEGVRLALQRRLDGGVELPRLLALTIVERAGDLFGILALLAAGAAATGRPLPAVALAGTVALGAVAVRGAGRVRWLPPIVARLARTVTAQRPATLARVAAASVIAWSLDGAAVAMLASAFGADVPAGRALLAAGLCALGVAVPTAPAGLGAHQAVMVFGLDGAATFEQAIAVSLGMIALIVIVQAALSAGAFALASLRARQAGPRAAA